MDFPMDDQELSEVKRAPPVPMEAIRRVAAFVLKKIPVMSTVEQFLQRSGLSLYNGRTSFFDILMMVFPRGKPLKTSRASFKDEPEAQHVAILLSWAATCERWCTEYEELRRLISSTERTSKYAAARSVQFVSAVETALKLPAVYALAVDTEWQKAVGKFEDIAPEVAESAVQLDDPLVTLTRQVLFTRPLVWHRELDTAATYTDPAIITRDGSHPDRPMANWDQPWTLAFREITGHGTTPVKFDDWKDGLIDDIVYVDGSAMTVWKVFTTAVEQLMEEAKLMYPSNQPRPRRGVCPAGQEYRVTYDGAVITDRALDAAVRAALRKYGPIKHVKVLCQAPEFEFTAIPLDESTLW